MVGICQQLPHDFQTILKPSDLFWGKKASFKNTSGYYDRIQYNDVLYQHASPEPTQLWSYYFESSERHKGFPHTSFMTQTYFTVKSADSGVQNSADGGREVLTSVPADNNLPEAGRNLSDAANSQIGI